MIITIPGNPIAQARVRLYTQRKKAVVYDPNGRDKVLIKRVITSYLREHYPDYKFPKHPRVSFLFHMPIPYSMPVYKKNIAKTGSMRHENRPDADNLMKLYLDCLNEIVIDDDSQISIGFAIKAYHEFPKTIILIQEMPDLIEPEELGFWSRVESNDKHYHATIQIPAEIKDHLGLADRRFVDMSYHPISI